MNGENLIELTKELIFQATHFNVPYIKQVYANNLLIVKVEKNGVVETMNKEQLVGFVKATVMQTSNRFLPKQNFIMLFATEIWVW